MAIDKIEDKVKKVLSRLKIRCRGISLDDDRLIVRAEVSKGTESYKKMIEEFKKLKLRKVNGFYGHWIFKVNM